MTSSSAAFVFGVVAEARADQQIACGFAERVLVEKVDWIEAETVSQLIRWQGADQSSEYLTWAGIAKRFQIAGLVSHGRFRSVPGALDERRARKALLLLSSLSEPPAGVLLVRDTDGEVGRTQSLERARQAGTWKFEVILATPHPKREAWVLAGFDPRNADEETVLEQTKSTLGFDPRLRAERLTAKGAHGKRNAKSVLASLTKDAERERACWRDADLAVLRERGESTRLVAYLTELTDRLVPIVAGRTPRDRL
jgi:hypothetical protein